MYITNIRSITVYHVCGTKARKIGQAPGPVEAPVRVLVLGQGKEKRKAKILCHTKWTIVEGSVMETKKMLSSHVHTRKGKKSKNQTGIGEGHGRIVRKHGGRILAYMNRIVDTGRIVEHRKMMTTRVHTKNATRAKNRSKTSKAQEKVNERQAEEKLRWLLNGNFGRADFHTVLHYFDKHRTLDEALADLKAFLRELRKRCKKLGLPWKYIACTETVHMTNIHHHVILPKMDPDIIATVWEKVTADSGGGISFRPLDRRGNHAKLARYLIKEVRSTQERMKQLGRRMKRYSTSRGLKKPEIHYEVIQARTWADEPRQRKGFLLLKNDDGEVTRQGWHEVNGWPWQEYFEMRIEGGRKDE